MFNVYQDNYVSGQKVQSTFTVSITILYLHGNLAIQWKKYKMIWNMFIWSMRLNSYSLNLISQLLSYDYGSIILLHKLSICLRGRKLVEMSLHIQKCRCCTVAVGCCVGDWTRGQMSRHVLCAVNQAAISSTCGSSGRQGWKKCKLLIY